jgi:hypothetical protein
MSKKKKYDSGHVRPMNRPHFSWRIFLYMSHFAIRWKFVGTAHGELPNSEIAKHTLEYHCYQRKKIKVYNTI